MNVLFPIPYSFILHGVLILNQGVQTICYRSEIDSVFRNRWRTLLSVDDLVSQTLEQLDDLGRDKSPVQEELRGLGGWGDFSKEQFMTSETSIFINEMIAHWSNGLPH